MSETGVATLNLPVTATADTVVVNKDGSTSLIKTADLATQISGSGALATILAGISQDQADKDALITANALGVSGLVARTVVLEENLTTGTLVVGTWADLLPVAGGGEGEGAEVLDSDAGTHSAATGTGYDGAAVNNAGRFSWNATWSRWVRIGDTGLTGKQVQIDALDLRARSVESVVSDFTIIGHPDRPLTGGALTASLANFVFGDVVQVASVARKVWFFADNPGPLELGAWTKSGDVHAKQRSVFVTAIAGYQELDIELPMEVGEGIGFYGASIVSYEDGAVVNDSGGWYAGSGGDSFNDAAASITGSRMQIGFEIWSLGDTTLAGLSTEQVQDAARIGVLEGRSIDHTSRNLFAPLSSQNLVDYYVTPSNGTPAALADYGVLGAFPVEAGKAYRLDITAALDVWEIYNHPDAVAYFYDAETMHTDNLISASAVGVNDVALSESDRVCTFTAPASATHVGVTVRRKSGTIGANDFEELLAAASLTGGLEVASLDAPAMADTKHDVAVQRLAEFLYVRCPYRPGNHVVYRVNADYTFPGSGNGVIDFDGVRLIAETEPYENTATAWAASAVVVNGGGDASPPFKLNGMYLGGGHGIVSQKVAKTAHGKTNADVGSTYTDGAAKTWVVCQIVDVDTFIVTPANTGNATEWIVTGGVTGDLTHAAGGTNTATITPDSTSGTQLWPIPQSYRYRAILDGKHRIIDDGVYFGDVLTLVEEYGIPNVASVLDHLVANVGSGDDPVFNDPAIQTQVEVQTAYTWDFTGIVEVVNTTVDIQDYTVNYHGGMQSQAMILGPNDTRYLHVPRCTTDTLATGMATTAIVSTLYVNSIDFTDAANPPDRFWQMTKRGSEKRHGWIMGYSKNAGLDRTALDVAFFIPNTSLKMYPYAVDAGHGATAVAGTLRETVGFFGAFDPNRDQDFNAKVLFRDAGKHSLYMQLPDAVSGKWVGLPERFIGQPVSTTFADGVTLHSTVVSAKGIWIKSAAGGELEVRVG